MILGLIVQGTASFFIISTDPALPGRITHLPDESSSSRIDSSISGLIIYRIG
ncbi:hypothetical protein GWK91_10215 [Virgibacillus sp. MSP4-1]|uniref:hypothetical protein n=1 Tax=Virgibacillus sp. MSP4-1 TaxID=2700081 RepID=UPI00039E4492|nr:hypothetical protein [Virgibacillus sp. MSP4-1]QHS23300.1 hypothetical protein GWK91_10215 [Virgibacillus sp. MSP4-1]